MPNDRANESTITRTTDPRVVGKDGKVYPRDYEANRAAIRTAILADPEATTTDIAKALGTTRDTVRSVRLAMQAPAQVPAVIDGRYQAMCTAIAACHEVDEVKELRNQALALEVYLKQANNFEAERFAIEIRIRAERQCGAMLKAQPKAKPSGSNQHGKKEEVSRDGIHPQRLSDIGITLNQSSQWQQLADIPDDEFEATLADRSEPLSTTRMIKATAKMPPETAKALKRVTPEALAIWGVLCDFEKKGFMQADVHALLDAMTESMREDTLRLAPLIGAFLMTVKEPS